MMKKSLVVYVSCLATLWFVSPTTHAGVTVLDFDSFDNGQIVDDEYANLGVSIDSYNYRDGLGISSGCYLRCKIPD